MKNSIAIAVMICTALYTGSAQDSRAVSRFKERSRSARESFEAAAKSQKQRFSALHDKAWEEFGAQSPIALPEDWKIKPVPYDNKPVTTKDVPVETVIDPDVPAPIAEVPELPEIPDDPETPVNPEVPDFPGVPDPVVPQMPVVSPKPVQNLVTIDFYGTSMSVSAPASGMVSIPKLDRKSLYSAINEIDARYSGMVQECKGLKERYDLCDWAYALMLDKFSKACCNSENEATLLMAYLFASSDYKMSLGKKADKIYLLFSCQSTIFKRSYFNIGREKYYVWGQSAPKDISAINLDFKDARSIKLDMRALPRLNMDMARMRLLKSEIGKLSASVSVNRNLVAFYNDYPRFYNYPDIMTRWAFYANTPLDANLKESIYPELERQLSGMSRKEALQALLYFVQTAFVYKLDDEVWGEDRAFFAEETLYYDYCDCEDRSILFSRLVRDLLGMDVVLVFYPGHLATAVKVGESMPGDRLSLPTGSFIICDPTYIGAPVGATMPDMDNQTAKVIMLKR